MIGTKRDAWILIAGAAILACDAPVAPEGVRTHDALAAAGAGVVASATGSAHTGSGAALRVVTFEARSKADGSVAGAFNLNLHALGVHFLASVECLTVVGNRALFGGTITSSNDARIRVGTKSYFWVEDNGEGAGATPDIVSLAGVNETQEGLDDFCNLVQNLLPPRVVEHGNVQVRSD